MDGPGAYIDPIPAMCLWLLGRGRDEDSDSRKEHWGDQGRANPRGTPARFCAGSLRGTDRSRAPSILRRERRARRRRQAVPDRRGLEAQKRAGRAHGRRPVRRSRLRCRPCFAFRRPSARAGARVRGDPALDGGLPQSHEVRATASALEELKRNSKLEFASDAAFHGELKRRVEEYFGRIGLSPRDSLRMYLKTAAMLLWFGASYALLVFAATSWWHGMLLSFSLALAMAGIGFTVQHDANHGAYSRKGAINHLMGMTLDLLGASSYVWRWKHNVFHHSYPNLSGADDDIDLGPFGSPSPAQPRYRIHRYQQFSLWALYGLLGPKWHFVDDFKNVIQARIARNRVPRPRGWRLLEMLGGKALFFSLALVVPALFHRWWVVLLFYAITAFVVGLTLSVVFQLAHCVEEADFPQLLPGTDQVPSAWAVHQVQTTVDFAPRNRLLTWYLGGLNFQIEHHLFPKICHVHYPRLSVIVRAVCAEFGVRYAAHDRLLGAVCSHWRWLRRMGAPTATPQSDASFFTTYQAETSL